MGRRKDRSPPVNQLMLTVGLELEDSKLLSESPHRERLADALPHSGLLRDARDVRVTYHEVDSAAPSVIRALPMGRLIAPLEYELFFAADGRCVTVRFRVMLDEYEGVSATQICVNILEFLEHGRVDAMTELPPNPPYSYTLHNGARAVALAFSNMSAVVLGALVSPLLGLLRIVGRVARLPERAAIGPAGPWAAIRTYVSGEHGACTAYDVPASLGYHDVINRLFALAADLNLRGLMATVNYRPRIAIARPRSPADLLDRQRRRACIVLPSGPPPTPNVAMATLLGNDVVINNYGRFNPNSSATFKSADWDWVGLQGWVFAAFIITINGRCHLLMRVPCTSAARVKALLAKFGPPCDEYLPVNANPDWRSQLTRNESSQRSG
jgi:hypothetical protein